MDATPCIHATPGMDAHQTPGMDARGTPGMDATRPLASMPPEQEKNKERNPENNQSLSALETILAAVPATNDEAREILQLIISEKQPTNPGRYIAAIATNGDLPTWLHRIRANTPVTPPPSRNNQILNDAMARAIQAEYAMGLRTLPTEGEPTP